jgi:uncharacterized protein (TIGR03790 family)
MKRIFLFTLLLLTPAFLRATTTPAQVIVVANDDNNESLQLARHYMNVRGIPAKNLITLSLSNNEEISWEVFTRTIWNPLFETLTKNGWLLGERLPETDSAGRHRIKISENKIGYIVLCRGVPLRIANNPALIATENNHTPTPPQQQGFAVTTASVDSELATLAMPKSSASGVVRNPLFGVQKPTLLERQRVVHVSRLDGPSLAACQMLVNNALLAEKNGLAGRAYVDVGGPHAQGDKWLRDTATLIGKTGYDLTLDETPHLLDYDTRADAPALYFGWYSAHIGGHFADPALRFAPGAVALHIHSFSAVTLRSATRGWTGPLVARGATVTFGNVAEPYLQFTTLPALFFAAMMAEWQIGDAYAAATPVWSWQTILIGDPLYRPLKVSFAQQLEKIKHGEDLPLRDYIVLRQANHLAAAGKGDAARTLLAAAIRRRPTFPLRLAVARLANQPGLAWSDEDATYTTDTGLLVELARYLRENLRPTEAHALYKLLLDRTSYPKTFRNKLLPEAIALATAVGDHDTADQWQDELPRSPVKPTAPKK